MNLFMFLYLKTVSITKDIKYFFNYIEGLLNSYGFMNISTKHERQKIINE